MCAAAPVPVLNALDILKVNICVANYLVKYDVLFVFYSIIKSISRYTSMSGFFYISGIFNSTGNWRRLTAKKILLPFTYPLYCFIQRRSLF
eukprot:UN11023